MVPNRTEWYRMVPNAPNGQDAFFKKRVGSAHVFQENCWSPTRFPKNASSLDTFSKNSSFVRCVVTFVRCFITFVRCVVTFFRCVVTFVRCVVYRNQCYNVLLFKRWNAWEMCEKYFELAIEGPNFFQALERLRNVWKIFRISHRRGKLFSSAWTPEKCVKNISN